MQMAEQLLILGCVDEVQLKSMDMVKARTDIGITLLSYSGVVTLVDRDLLIPIYDLIMDMRERLLLL